MVSGNLDQDDPDAVGILGLHLDQAPRPGYRDGSAGQDLVLARRAPSDGADVLRLRSLLSPGRVELDLLVLVQRPVAVCRDCGEVDEHVRRPVIGGDETKALIGVEPLHCACCHVSEVLIHHATARPRRADREYTRSLDENQKVEFETTQGQKGPQAENVRPL